MHQYSYPGDITMFPQEAPCRCFFDFAIFYLNFISRYVIVHKTSKLFLFQILLSFLPAQVNYTLILNANKKEGFLTFYNQISTEQEHIQAQIEALQKKIKALPKGALLCVRNGNYIKWFKSNGKHPIYIPKKERHLAEALALKKFYQLQLEELTSLLQLSEAYAQNKKESSLSLLDDSSCFKELLAPHFNSFPNELQQWANADYEHNPLHPEHLIHNTIAGYKVRSKSEVIIVNTLFANRIPFRYECALTVQNMIFYPDLTIRHPKSGELIYWEHFGMMDKPVYCDKAFQKLRIYASEGIIPSINLITTYETADHPINSEKIQQIVRDFFLAE